MLAERTRGEQVHKPKTALKAAASGYGLAILAPLFVNVLKHVVGG